MIFSCFRSKRSEQKSDLPTRKGQPTKTLAQSVQKGRQLATGQPVQVKLAPRTAVLQTPKQAVGCRIAEATGGHCFPQLSSESAKKITKQSEQQKLAKIPPITTRTKEPMPILENQESTPISNERTLFDEKAEIPTEATPTSAFTSTPTLNRPTSPPSMRPMYIDQQEELRVALARRAAKQAIILKQDDDENVEK